jgi:hypothetical protein
MRSMKSTVPRHMQVQRSSNAEIAGWFPMRLLSVSTCPERAIPRRASGQRRRLRKKRDLSAPASRRMTAGTICPQRGEKEGGKGKRPHEDAADHQDMNHSRPTFGALNLPDRPYSGSTL